MRGIGPNKRPTALIFQNLALFPLMPVWENIAFGLEVRGVDKADRRGRARGTAATWSTCPARRTSRSASSPAARSSASPSPARSRSSRKVMLLDEPLSALDLKLRQHMRAELRAIQKRTDVTFIYITHDQGEALAMSDRVGVMSQRRAAAGRRAAGRSTTTRPTASSPPSSARTTCFAGRVMRGSQAAGPRSRRRPALLLGRDLARPARGRPGHAVRAAGATAPRRWRRRPDISRKPAQPVRNSRAPSSMSSSKPVQGRGDRGAEATNAGRRPRHAGARARLHAELRPRATPSSCPTSRDRPSWR